EAKGNLFTQAALETLRPLLGTQPVGKGLNDRKEIEKFVAEHYGPTTAMIQASIGDITGQEVGGSRDATVEEGQRIKELVARVGSLEFRILANQHDDKLGQEDAAAFINNPSTKAVLEQAAIRGEPPPGPMEPGGQKLKKYTIDLPHNTKSTVTYSWVE